MTYSHKSYVTWRLTFDEFVAFLSQPSLPGTYKIDRTLRYGQEVGDSETFDDGFSILQVRFA